MPRADSCALLASLMIICYLDRSGESLAQMTDPDKLRRLEIYMTHEGMHPTAEAARLRLYDLGRKGDQGGPARNAAVEISSAKAAKEELMAWTVREER